MLTRNAETYSPRRELVRYYVREYGTVVFGLIFGGIAITFFLWVGRVWVHSDLPAGPPITAVGRVARIFPQDRKIPRTVVAIMVSLNGEERSGKVEMGLIGKIHIGEAAKLTYRIGRTG